MRKTRCAVCRMNATVRSASAHNRTWPWSQNDESAVEPNGVQLRESRSRALALLQSAWALDLVRPQLTLTRLMRPSASEQPISEPKALAREVRTLESYLPIG